MEKLPKLYKDLPDLQHTSVFLDADVYRQAIESFVITCADTLFINRANKTFYLAKRQVMPCDDWYMFGGRLKRGQTELEAAQANLARETGITFSHDRFEYFGLRRFWWKSREQEPQDQGTDTYIFIFLVEPTQEELSLASTNLDPIEYDASSVLREFSREELSELHPVLTDIYDELFVD